MAENPTTQSVETNNWYWDFFIHSMKVKENSASDYKVGLVVSKDAQGKIVPFKLSEHATKKTPLYIVVKEIDEDAENIMCLASGCVKKESLKFAEDTTQWDTEDTTSKMTVLDFFSTRSLIRLA